MPINRIRGRCRLICRFCLCQTDQACPIYQSGIINSSSHEEMAHGNFSSDSNKTDMIICAALESGESLDCGGHPSTTADTGHLPIDAGIEAIPDPPATPYP